MRLAFGIRRRCELVRIVVLPLLRFPLSAYFSGLRMCWSPYFRRTYWRHTPEFQTSDNTEITQSTLQPLTTSNEYYHCYNPAYNSMTIAAVGHSTCVSQVCRDLTWLVSVSKDAVRHLSLPPLSLCCYYTAVHGYPGIVPAVNLLIIYRQSDAQFITSSHSITSNTNLFKIYIYLTYSQLF